MPNREKILLYHGNCPDGFGSAFAFWKKYDVECEYVSLNHSDSKYHGFDIERLRDKDVFMADISFRREDIMDAKEIANSFYVIDHHVSAMKDLEGLDFCHFDMNKSGAMLSWEFLFPDEDPPKLISYIQDRDLWKFDLPNSDNILMAVDSYKRSFDVWDRLCRKMQTKYGFEELLREGKAIRRYRDVLMEILKNNTFRMNIAGYNIPVLNIPFFKTELVNDLARGEPFAMGYHFNGRKFVFSLRSEPSGGRSVDVSKIAAYLAPEGGGHKHAAGFALRDFSDLKEE